MNQRDRDEIIAALRKDMEIGEKKFSAEFRSGFATGFRGAVGLMRWAHSLDHGDIAWLLDHHIAEMERWNPAKEAK